MHERRVADLLRVPQKRRGHLRVEQGTRQRAHLAQQYLEVLPARVEQLHHGLVLQQRRQHAQIIDLEGIHDGRLVVGGQLQKAQLRVIGLLAQKLRVDGEHARAHRPIRERLEIFLVCYVHRGVLTVPCLVFPAPCCTMPS